MNFKVFVFIALFLVAPTFSHAATPSVGATPIVGTASSTPKEWSVDYSKISLRIGSEVYREAKYDEEDLVNIFLVRNGRLYEDFKWTKNTKSNDYLVWNIFAKIAGDAFVAKYVYAYLGYKDITDPTLAFVEPLGRKEPMWGLAVNTNASDFSNKKWLRDMALTLIHEYTHVLTLHVGQVNPRTSKLKCAKQTLYYDAVAGCADKKSYIQAYVSKFWTLKEQEAAWRARSGEYTEEYYKDHKSEYVSLYAATSPTEDIAESFTAFIVGSKPTGVDEKDLKVLFFYDYKELVEMRTRIRAEVKQYF